MKKILLVWLAMVMLIAVPCLSFAEYQGQIPICQNNKTGVLRFAPMKNIGSANNADYEPYCTATTETLIWVTLGQPGLPALYEPMTNVREADLTAQGWTECYSDLYNSNAPLSTALAQCNKSNLMLACRPVGSTSFTLAAFANRNDVLTDTGTDATTTHIANGAAWYFNSDYSWGFAKAGDPVVKSECDVETGPNPDLRLCWHTLNNGKLFGWRCGATTSLNSSAAWQRVILHHD